MDPETAFMQLADEFAEIGIKASSMFGSRVLKLDRRPVAGLANDGVFFKLKADSDAFELANSLEGSHPFQPEMKSRKGPVMKQWIVVPLKHQKRYDELLQAAIQYVANSSS